LTHVTIEGTHFWSWTRKSLLPVYQGIGVDQESVEEGRQALTSYFQAKGYFDAIVNAQLKSEKTGNIIVYQISREKKHKVAKVQLSGNAHLTNSDLTPHIDVQKSHLFSPGKLSDQLVRSSANKLTAVYRSEGFSSVKVTPSVVTHQGDIQVVFRVTEGPRDIVNSLNIEGADTLPESQFAPAGLN
jgi:outer membrane protein assembly factor BamA